MKACLDAPGICRWRDVLSLFQGHVPGFKVQDMFSNYRQIGQGYGLMFKEKCIETLGHNKLLKQSKFEKLS